MCSSPPKISEDALLDSIQRQAFDYFLRYTYPDTGLVADSSVENFPASIAATGLSLSTYPVAVERSFIARAEALQRTLTCLRFFVAGHKNSAISKNGFFFHFLDGKSGERAWKSEISSIDSALLFAGALTASAYFDLDTAPEREVRDLALSLCEGADWNWMRAGREAVGHGWKPESGFLASQWTGYNEALLLYVLGLGSASHPLPASSYHAWTSPFRWKRIYEHEFAYAGPLFIHQLAQCWLDLRGIRDNYMRAKDSDYFQNSRRATLVQREYAIRNPRSFKGYGEDSWGITACDGPGQRTHQVDGHERRFYGYRARGAPFGPDDGTLAPWVAAASLPFCPEAVLPLLRRFGPAEHDQPNLYKFDATFNPTFPTPEKQAWASSIQMGLNLGPVVLMLENYRSGIVWDLLREQPIIRRGLERAGFRPA